METVYIVVLDYANCAVRFYQAEFQDDWQVQDIEIYLEQQDPPFNNSSMYYMCSLRPIHVSTEY